MQVVESDLVRWLLRTLVILVASWCGGRLTGVLLGLILKSFGFIAFAITSTVMSYSLFWFAWFGLPSLILARNKARLSRFIRPASSGVLLVLFAVTAATVSACSSAVYLISEVAQTSPDSPSLIWLIAIPFFGFILYMAYKLEESMRRGI